VNTIPNRLGGRVCAAAFGILTLATAAYGTSGPQGHDLTADDLKALTYGDNIPGFRQISVQKDHEGPYVLLQGPSDGTVASGYITSLWESADTLNHLRITVRVCRSADAARTAVRQVTSSPSVRDAQAQQVGEESWARIGVAYAALRFRLGRVAVFLGMYPNNRRSPDGSAVVSQMDAHLDDVVRPLAHGLEWVIRQRPELLADGDRGSLRVVASGTTAPTASSLTMRNVAWADLSAFRLAGAEVKWDAEAGRGAVTYRGRQMELNAFMKAARLGAKKLDLGSAVTVTPVGPIVPLRKVAEALGMRVRVRGATIELG